MSADAGYRLAPAAAEDARSILRHTLRRFGTTQHDAYTALMSLALQQVAKLPDRIGSRDCSQIEAGLRAFPLRLAARRQSAAAHVVFYRTLPSGVLIVRILHESMDPTQHIGAPDP